MAKRIRKEIAMCDVAPYCNHLVMEERFRPGEISMNAKLIASMTLAGLAAVFIIQNIAVTELTFLFWTLSMSRAFF